MLGTVLVLTGVVAACSGKDATPCAPKDYAPCACPSGVPGYSQCEANGDGYGLCDCSGVSPVVPVATSAPDAGGSDGASEEGALLGFMEACSTNEQCETGLCFPFNAKGPKCSKPCTSASDCPPPAAGCSNQNICKAP